jgi:hypothetical protein
MDSDMAEDAATPTQIEPSITIAEFCAGERISRTTGWRIMKRKEIDYYMAGGQVRITLEAVRKYRSGGKQSKAR